MKPPILLLLSGLLHLGTTLGAAPPGAKWTFSKQYAGYNVIFISITNVAADRMNLYGYRRETTPKLDQWSKDAFVFDNAFTQATWTLPVGVSIFTSLYPYAHGILTRNLHNALENKTKTLPELLRDAGYATGAFTGGLDYYPGFSHMRGFQEAPENPNFSGFKTTIPQAQKFLAKHEHEKFFLFLHGYDTHCPYRPAEPFRGAFGSTDTAKLHVDPTLCVRGYQSGKDYTAMYSGGCPNFPKEEKCSDKFHQQVHLTRKDIDYLSDRYDETVRQADDLVGEFLASLGRDILQKTIIIVYSEHGEMFAKHGRFGRAGTVRGASYDDVLHVPLILRFPGSQGKRIGELVQLIDIMPTLLDALALQNPGVTQGVSLAPLIEDGTPVAPYVYSGAVYNMGLGTPTYLTNSGEKPRGAAYGRKSLSESIRDRRWKLIHEILIDRDENEAPQRRRHERFELYDISQDPAENHEISRLHPEILLKLRAQLHEWNRRTHGNTNILETHPMPEKLLREAREHGYWQ